MKNSRWLGCMVGLMVIFVGGCTTSGAAAPATWTEPAPVPACVQGEESLDDRWISWSGDEQVLSATVSNGRAAIAGAGGRVGLWSIESGGPELDEFLSTDLAAYGGGPECAVAFSVAGDRVVFAEGAGDVVLRDGEGSEIARLPGDTGLPAADVALSDDGALVAIAGFGEGVRIWSPDTSEVVEAPDRFSARDLAFVAGGHDLVVGGWTFEGWAAVDAVELWSAADGWARRAGWSVGDVRKIAVVGAETVVAASRGAVARIDLTDGEGGAVLTDVAWHDPVAIAASPDGTSFATVGAEGTVRTFSIATMTERSRRDLALQVAVEWDPSGDGLHVVGRDGLIRSLGCAE